jgi:N-acetylglucosamine-6-phosphate deacetylase
MIRIHANHYATDQPVELIVENGLIRSVQALETVDRGAQGAERARYVAPAFFDLQINGCLGRDFSSDSLSADDIRSVVSTCRQHGIAGFFPTLITNSFAGLRQGFEALRTAIDGDRDLAHALPGFHLEGPYISSEDGPRGAHPGEHVRPPAWDEFQRLQDSAGGRIRLVTLAPEHEGALAFIEKLTAADVVVSIGHTAAGPARIREAIAAGARLSTHLGNGCHLQLPRHENYLWEQLAADELWASLICDGHHLPAAVMQCFIRMKTPARLILTCDASPLAGLPPGRYHKWGQEIDVLPSGKIVVAKQGVLAGSGSFTDQCVAHAIKVGGVSLKDAVDMAGERPRRLLGLPPVRLEPGMPADLVLFDLDSDGALQVRHIVVNGQVYR